MKTISAQKFVELRHAQPNLQVLDVRTGFEYRSLHLEDDHIHMPLSEISARKVEGQLSHPFEPLYVICRTDNRSRQAAQSLEKGGMKALVVVEGGMQALERLGVPMIKGEGMSLDRQLRLVAGLLVLLGVLLGASVDSSFYILAGFVGAGLAFSGLTGWCGLALLLAKAPWNRERAIACSPHGPC